MKKEDKTRERLSKIFEDFEAEPQPESWEQIRVAIRKKRKKRPLIGFFWFLGVSLVIGICLFTFKIAGGADTQQSASTTKVEQSKSETDKTNLSTNFDTSKTTATTAIGSEERPFQNTPVTDLTSASKQMKPLNVPATVSSQKGAIAAPESHFFSNQPSATDIIAGATTQIAAEPFLTKKEPEQATQKITTIEQATLSINSDQKNTAQVDNFTRLPVRIVPVQTMTDQPKNTIPAAIVPVIKVVKNDRKRGFTVEVAALSTFQLTQSQVYQSTFATNIRVLPTFDARRLGTSLAIGYQLPLRKRADVSGALTWMNLPFRAQYEVASANQVRINLQSGNPYKTERIAQSAVDEVRRQNWFGMQLQYGYTMRIFNTPIRAFVSGDGLLSVSNSQPESWAGAGMNIPIGKGKYQVSPVFKYQLNRIEQPDQLLQTRLYTIGLGIKRSFN